MFEAEIMITGYTIIVSSVTFAITKKVYKHKLKKLTKEMANLQVENTLLKKK